MAQTKRASRGKRPSKAVSALGIAGMSLAASTGGSQAEMPVASAGPTLGSATDMLWQNAAPFRIPMLDEEEISDVSLATFYLFDKDNLGTSRPGVQAAAFPRRLRLRTWLRRGLQRLWRRLSRLRCWRL